MVENILVTGGAGFIGHLTANELARRGYRVRVLDNLSRQIHPTPRESLGRLDPEVEFILGDVCDPSIVHTALQDIDVVYHLASETGVGQSMYEIQRYSQVNIQGTAVICDSVVKGKSRVRRMILSSSRAVYGEGSYLCTNCQQPAYPGGRNVGQLQAGEWDHSCAHCDSELRPVPCTESMPSRPVSVYGLTKRVQEELFTMVSETYGVPVAIVRYFNVFGSGQTIANPYAGVLTLFCSRLLRDEGLEIYEDGLMQRDFVPVQEVVNANLSVLGIDRSEALVLNIGTGASRTILQMAELLKTEIGSRSRISLSGRYRVGDIRHCYADVSRKNSLVGLSPKDSFQQAIRDLVAWVKGQQTEDTVGPSVTELTKYGLTGVAACK